MNNEKFKVSNEIKEFINNQIRGHIALRGKTIKDVAQTVHEVYDRKENPQLITSKLKNGTIKYAEIIEIAKVLNYKIEFVDMDEPHKKL